MITGSSKKWIAMGLAFALTVAGIGQVEWKGVRAAGTENTSGAAVTASGSSIGTATPIPTATPTATPTTTKLTAPTSVTVQGGSARVRVSWGKVSGATGYYVYLRQASATTYSKVKTITDGATTSVDVKSLVQNSTYYACVSAYVKNADGTVTESDLSTTAVASTAAVSKTSKTPKKYSNKKKFQASPAYKKYKRMRTIMNYSKSFAIPGMKTTNVAGFSSTSMVPQGICQAGGYFLISAYDSKGLDYSVVYVLSRSSKSYITTLVLPSKAKVGGIAFDGTNIWISKGTSVACFPYSVITTMVSDGVSYRSLAKYTSVIKVGSTASYMGYYNGILWVGAYKTATSSMTGYQVGNVNTTPTLAKKYTMDVPSKVQGITFDSDGTLILTRGCGKNNTDSGYVSHIRTYSPSYSTPKANGKILKNACKKITRVPPKVEGVAVYGTYTYVLSSSCHYSSCKYPVDRVIAMKTAKMLA